MSTNALFYFCTPFSNKKYRRKITILLIILYKTNANVQWIWLMKVTFWKMNNCSRCLHKVNGYLERECFYYIHKNAFTSICMPLSLTYKGGTNQLDVLLMVEILDKMRSKLKVRVKTRPNTLKQVLSSFMVF